MIDTILNVDLDFLTKPYYEGNHYVVPEWRSITDFKSIAKRWIEPEDIIKKMKLDEMIVKGDSVFADKQVLFSWEKVVAKKLVKMPFRIVNFDAHLDMYSVNSDGDYYDIFSLANFNDFDSLIAPFKYGWVDRIDWIVPDYFEEKDIEKQFSFIKPIDLENGVYTLYVSDKFDVKVKIIKYSELDISEYDIKYFSVVLNSDKCHYDDDLILKFTNHMKR